MLVYVINLQRHAERRRHIAEQLDIPGLEMAWINAVDGRALTADEMAARAAYPAAGSYDLTPTQCGCYLSHIKCWEAFLATSAPFATIFEDDVHLGENIGDLLNRTEQWIPADADTVKLETCLQPVRLPRRPAGKANDRDLYRLTARHLGAAGYIISRKGARKLLKNSEKLAMGVDAAIFNPRPLLKHRMVNYQVVPAICIQDDIAYRCGLPHRGHASSNPVPDSSKSYGTSAAGRAVYRTRDHLRRAELWIKDAISGARKQIIGFR